MNGGLNRANGLRATPFDRLIELLAIRLGYQTTIAKSLVSRANGLIQRFLNTFLIHNPA